MTQDFVSRYKLLYGDEPRVFRAPGRVNLIGEHTDYNGGFVMPAALQFATWVAAGPRTDGRVVLHSYSFEGEEVSFALADLAPGQAAHHWADYVRGIAWVLHTSGRPLQGANLLIEGNVPIGSGLSSSASIEVATCLALLRINGYEEPVGPVLAQLCQRAENEYVGMRCGIMDQFISCCGQKDQALVLDCRSLEYDLVPLSDRARLVICNSGVHHALAGGEYNKRRASCEEGAKMLGVESLRDAHLRDLDLLPEELLKRCRHVVSENLRVSEAAAALTNSDLGRFGELMYASHASLRDDYEVSCEELDILVELAHGLPGVYGARMTGGGFGGCTVNLVRVEEADAFAEEIARLYLERTGKVAAVYICQPSAGAGEV